ncbi:MAG: protease inhibitor I42 family protein [Verrucomicrobiota bacterium]|jgi:inhibitor of cysteine peptidase
MITKSRPQPLGSFLLAVIFAAGLARCVAQGSPPPGGLILTETDNGKTVTAVVGEPIAINLRGNPSTGYAWSQTSTNGDSVVANGTATYTSDPGGGAGVGGTYLFPFSGVKPGQTTLAFAYSQPWNPASPAQTFLVTINVAADDVLPRLYIEVVNGTVVIRWPIANSDGFYLEGATELQPADWAALNVAAVPDGDLYKVTLGASGNMLVFRLHK